MKLLTLPFFLVGSCFAADLSGIWSGQVAARFGDIDDVSFKFEQTGAALAGKIYGDNESTPVKDGKVEGDQISFSITTEMNGGPRTFQYFGKIIGNEIQIERKRVMNPGDPPPKEPPKQQVFTLKRVL